MSQILIIRRVFKEIKCKYCKETFYSFDYFQRTTYAVSHLILPRGNIYF